ncbi:MAG: hypothetical protein ACREK5_10190 [Gemmatimonadota bacterium]
MIDPAPDDRSGTNLELKARVHDHGKTRERVRIAGSPGFVSVWRSNRRTW